MDNNFGTYLLRNIVLPDILENDAQEILYWEGKKLFTTFAEDIKEIDELAAFFDNAQFGTLETKKEGKHKYEFKLSNDMIQQRIKENPEFSLEAGFLCEYVQTITNSYCISNINVKSKSVIITIDIDSKSNVN